MSTTRKSREMEEKDGKIASLCPVCKVGVKKEDKAVSCEICNLWFHISCENVTAEQYKFLAKEENSRIHWFCSDCEEDSINNAKVLHHLKSRQDRYEEELEIMNRDLQVIKQDVQKQNESLKSKISKQDLTDLEELISQKMDTLETKVMNQVEERFNKDNSNSKPAKDELLTIIECKMAEFEVKHSEKNPEPKWSDIVAKEVDNKMTTINEDFVVIQKSITETKSRLTEDKDRESRTRNIIIYRVSEASGTNEEKQKLDKEFCKNLIEDVLEIDFDNQDLTKVIRLGKRVDNKDRPLLIQCKEKSLKNAIMESLFKLKNAESKFKDISVTHDMTKQDRSECKLLVDEAKKKQSEEKGEYIWRVRGNPGELKVVKINKK